VQIPGMAGRTHPRATDGRETPTMAKSLLERLDMRVPARATLIPRVRHVVVDLAQSHGLPDPGAVGLAVTEALTNVVLHAYPGDEPGEVRIVVCPEPEELVVVIRDWGSGMRPRRDTPGLGLGLPTIASLTDRFDVEDADGRGTLLRMHFQRRVRLAA
jgi:serine/threonine-protein kinase RsbW